MTKGKFFKVALLAVAAVGLLALAGIAWADNTPQTLPFTQDWTNTNLITTNDDWSGVPGIVGYRGDNLTTTTGTNPGSITANGSGTPQDVLANQTDPNANPAAGVGIAEFQLTNPVVALQGDSTADAPHLLINVNTAGQSGINVFYFLRDLDGSSDNAVQPVALQYRVGSTGSFTNVSTVADATTGPNQATRVTPVFARLPAAANNQQLVQVRIITANASGNDEWVGVDNINVQSDSNINNNDPPVNTVPGAQSTNEDTALVFSSGNSNQIFIADPDAVNNPVQVTLTETNGTLTLGSTTGVTVTGNGTSTVTVTGTTTNINNALNGLRFDPTPNYNGSASLQITTNDQGNSGSGGAKSDTDTVNITVNPVNDVPSFTKGTNQTVAEDAGAQTVSGFATGISPGPANESSQAVSFEVINDNNALFTASGQPAISSNGTLTYTPAANASGTATVTARIKDNGGTANGGVDNSAPQTFTITVTPINDAPGATNETATTSEDTSRTITLTGTDIDGNNLSFAITSNPTNGTLSSVDAPTCAGTAPRTCSAQVTYTPNANYNGPDSFKYRVNDGTANSNEATVTLTVTPVNDPPDAVNDSATTNEDTPVTLDVLANDTDQEEDSLTVTSNTQGTNGTVSCTGDGSCTYTPNANFNGTDSFTYAVSDGNGGTDTATVNVTVNAVNDPPDAVNDTATTNEDTAATLNVLANDSDVEGNPLTLTSNTQGTNGTVSCTGSGNCTYTPNSNFNGTDSFTYTISDGNGGTDTAVVTITVTPVNDTPDAVNDTATTDEDIAVAANVLANDTDSDGDSLTVTTNTQGTNGTVSCTGSGNCTYTPNSNFNGTDSFTYTVSDGNGGTDTATVTITINAVNDPPTISEIEDQITPEDTATAAIPFTIGDIETPAQQLTVEGVSGNQSLVPDENIVVEGTGENRTVTITPNPNQSGRVTIRLLVRDANGAIATETFSLLVTPVNDAPVARDDGPYETNEDTTLTVSADDGVLNNDSDRDSVNLTAVKVSDPTKGTVTLNSDGSFTYTPQANATGDDSFTYRACDDANPPACSDPATVTISSMSVNDSPTISNIPSQSTPEETPIVVDFTVDDMESSPEQLTVTGASDDQSLVRDENIDVDCDGANCTVTITPETDQVGTLQITLTATDPNGGTSTETFTLEITPVNDAPVVDLNGDETGIDFAATSTEDGGAVGIVDSDATVTDVDNVRMRSATVTLTNRPDGEAESLSIDTSGTDITASYDPATGVLSLTGLAPRVEYQQVLRTVEYNNTSQAPSTGDRRVEFVINDGTDDSVTAVSTVTVNDANDPPVNTVPGAQSVTEDSALTFSDGNRISISDIDAGNNPVQVTLTGTNGTLTLGSTTGVTGNGTSTVTVTGTITDINNALDGLRFDPAADFNGTASFAISTDDQGNTGSDGAKSDTDSVTITVDEETDLSITKTGSTDPVTFGDELTYQISATNNGPSEARNVEVTDTLPANTTFVSATPDPASGSCTTPAAGANGTVECIFTSLAEDATATVSIVVKPTAAGGSIENTATVGSDTTDPDSSDDSATITTAVNAANLTIDKIDRPDPVVAGQNFEYVLSVQNTSQGDARNTVVTDTLPDDVTLVEAPDCTYDFQTRVVTCPLGTVASGASAVERVITVTAPSEATSFINTATVKSPNDPTNGRDRQRATTVKGSSDLQIEKVGPETVTDEEEFDYALTVTNRGPSTDSAVLVEDTLPAGVEFVSAESDKDTCTYDPRDPDDSNDNTVTCELTDPLPGAPGSDPQNPSNEADFTVSVKAKTPGLQTNTAEVDGLTNDPTPGNNRATAETTIEASADLSITKDSEPATVRDEDEFTYRLTVTNNGGLSDAENVKVEDTLPNDVEFVSSSQGCQNAGGTVTCTQASLPSAAGQNTKTFEISVKAKTPGTVTNTAVVSSATADSEDGNNSDDATITIDAEEADLSITKTDSPDPVNVGQNLIFLMTVTNVGPSPASNVKITDALPANTTFVSATPSQDGSCVTPRVGENGTVECTFASLAKDAKVMAKIVVRPTAAAAGTTLQNTARVSSDTDDPDSSDDSATANTFVRPVNDPPPAPAPANSAPVAEDDSYTTDEDKELKVPAPGVLENDTDTENETLTARLVSNPQNGTLDLNSNGSFTYKPNTDFNGTDTFTYKANDGEDDSNTATVTIVVTPQDEPDPRGCTVTGTSGNDNMSTTSGNDVICGGGGNDTINGGDGDDVIYGGPGNDRISGGTGKDRIYGEDGRDIINVRDRVRGNDLADGGAGKRDDCVADRRDKRAGCP